MRHHGSPHLGHFTNPGHRPASSGSLFLLSRLAWKLFTWVLPFGTPPWLKCRLGILSTFCPITAVRQQSGDRVRACSRKAQGSGLLRTGSRVLCNLRCTGVYCPCSAQRWWSRCRRDPRSRFEARKPKGLQSRRSPAPQLVSTARSGYCTGLAERLRAAVAYPAEPTRPCRPSPNTRRIPDLSLCTHGLCCRAAAPNGMSLKSTLVSKGSVPPGLVISLRSSSSIAPSNP